MLVVTGIHLSAPEWERAGLLLVLLLLIVIGTYCASRVSGLDGDPDPSSVVIDEVAGQILCQLWVPVSALHLILGFMLFRIFDVWKPFPARQIEFLPKGVGIMGDDLVAGIYAGATLLAIHQVLLSVAA